MPKQNDLPTPVTVNQKFLAKAAGMDVELPTAITMDQMYLQAIAEGSGGGSGDAYTKEETDELLDGKADLVDGKVPASELPSYVDDTVEGYYYQGAFYEDSEHTITITGETGKIYIDLTTNKSYRWTGTVYVRIDECPAFGETQGTIYEGNKGKQNADAIAAIKDGTNIDSFADVETALAAKLNTADVDSALSSTSTNPVQNKVVQAAIAERYTKSETGTLLADKVDKVTGKGLSTNDYTNADKTKLDGLDTGIAKAGTFTAAANQYVYTNQSFTVPAEKVAIFTASVFYNASKPNALKVGKNADPEATDEDATLWFHEVGEVSLGALSVSGITQKRQTNITYYIHAKYAGAGANAVSLYYRII